MQSNNTLGENIQTNTSTGPGFVDLNAAAGTSQASQAPRTTPMNPGKDIVFRDKPKKNVGTMIGIIILIFLAGGGAGFGTWAYLSGNQQQEQLNSRINELNQQNNELQEKLNNASATTDGNSTEIINTEGFIYVGKWGVKFKIPNQLQRVQYEFTNTNHSGFKFETDSLCVSGQSKEGVYEFNNLNDGAYICISKNYGEGAGIENDSLPPSLIHPEGEYFIQNPQAVYSLDDDSKAVELESLELIKNMLSEENMSKI